MPFSRQPILLTELKSSTRSFALIWAWKKLILSPLFPGSFLASTRVRIFTIFWKVTIRLIVRHLHLEWQQVIFFIRASSMSEYLTKATGSAAFICLIFQIGMSWLLTEFRSRMMWGCSSSIFFLCSWSNFQSTWRSRKTWQYWLHQPSVISGPSRTVLTNMPRACPGWSSPLSALRKCLSLTGRKSFMSLGKVATGNCNAINNLAG